MIEQIFHRLLLRRHFWRHATFSEVAELYASRLLRMMAVYIAGAFMSIYLYQNGYSIAFIAAYWAIYYFLKVFIAFPSIRYAARFGPKHGILLSNLLYIPSMLTFTLVPQIGIAAIVVTGIFQGVSTTLYSVCHAIDFSKVKSGEHAGKEIGYMNIVEKVATGLSPVLGGLLAYVAGPQTAMWAAAGLFACAAVPLLRTPEPIPTRHVLTMKGFPWKAAYRSMTANFGVGFDIVASGTVWSLLVAVAIVGVHANNQVYAVIGILSSVIMVAALAASYTYGKLIDRRRGRELLVAGVVGDALVHAARPFVQSVGGAAGINIANEAATTAYTMAFTRGMFDTADSSGHRLIYLGCMEITADLGASLAAAILLGLTQFMTEVPAMRTFFFVAAAVVLVIATPKFRLYQK